jgi:hypothetical protein
MEQVVLEQSCNRGRPRAANQFLVRVRLLEDVWTLLEAPVPCMPVVVDMGGIIEQGCLDSWCRFGEVRLPCLASCLSFRASYPTTSIPRWMWGMHEARIVEDVPSSLQNVARAVWDDS